MCDLVVRDLNTILVCRVHKVPHDILRVRRASSAALLNCIHIDFSNGFLGMVSSLVPREWCPVKHEVDGAEAHVKVVVQIG